MLLVLITCAYFALLFGLALWVESSPKRRLWAENPYVFALSLGVYCTAWTFYGSLAKAGTGSWSFLSIYLGPTLLMPAWWVVMRKLNRIVRSQGMTSLADVLSARYGKSTTLGTLVTLGCLFGITPYLALQIKAIAESSALWQGMAPQHLFWLDPAFYYTILMAWFIWHFGLRRLELSQTRPGMMAGIAFESLFKLLVFLGVGIWAVWFLFGSWDRLKEAAPLDWARYQLGTELMGLSWFLDSLLAGLAFWLLPRQFHLAVIEQSKESQLRTGLWFVPLYFLLINLFVLPLALAIGVYLPNGAWGGWWSDLSLLALPMEAGSDFWAILVFLGGFSAASSMMIVSVTSLSIMLSNNLILPWALRRGWVSSKDRDWSKVLPRLRPWALALIMFLAYAYYQIATAERSLINIGLNSFVAVVQFAPALLLGLYWKGAAKVAVIRGLILGFVIWFLLLIVPALGLGPLAWCLPSFLWDAEGRYWLWQWFLLPELSPVASTFVWSILVNGGTILFYSPFCRREAEEWRQAEWFVDVYKYVQIQDNRLIQTRGLALAPDVRALLTRFLGPHRTEQALAQHAKQHGWQEPEEGKASPEMLALAEKLLTGALGASSAQILLSSVLSQEHIGLPELMALLEESQQILELNRQLRLKSKQVQKAKLALEQANERLHKAQQLKDEFLYTVTHELRTPLTSIRAFAELMQDDAEMPEEDRSHFLHLMILELERLSRLITTVLDLEKYEAGSQSLQLSQVDLAVLCRETVEALKPLFEQKRLRLSLDFRPMPYWVMADRDKIQQVLHNLLGNALKFAETWVGLSLYVLEGEVRLKVSDDGRGLSDEDKLRVFDKFYQAKSSGGVGGLKGTGLGLAICEKIMLLHQGRIWVEDLGAGERGSRFCLSLKACQPPKPLTLSFGA